MATITGDIARDMSRALIDRYFRTVPYPYTRHHIDSYDQFLQQGLPSIIKSNNPILLVKEPLPGLENTYRYKIEIYVGGEDGSEIEIGTPTISLQNTSEVRLLFPNEARLRNLTYAASVYANIRVKLTYSTVDGGVLKQTDLPIPAETFQKYELFKIPIMLHSRYCLLNGKPADFLREAGECPYDNGGYFVVDGAEKVLITRQEQAFNTLYVSHQPADPQVKIYATMSCLSPRTRQTKRVSFYLNRKTGAIQVQFPFIRKPVPVFIAFRALGFQSDEEIMRMIFPNFESPEAKLMMDRLQPSIVEAHPFLNTHMAIQYMKTLTKGFGEVNVLDILKNQTFTHMPNDGASQAVFLGDCIRRIIRTDIGFDKPTDRDDTRNQRCLVSGFLVQMLFGSVYGLWRKMVAATIDRIYNTDKGTAYGGERFVNMFNVGTADQIFNKGMITDGLMRGYRGKWGSGLGEEKTGVLQALSRLSYCDFMSHCRRVILDFDTGMKLTGPRKLHTSQYGYFCTSETPTGASIGITKNLTIMAGVSTAAQTEEFAAWLRTRGGVYPVGDMSADQRAAFVPVYLNGGIFGYTAQPDLLTRVLRAFKRSGCLPYSASIVFSVRERCVLIYLDSGRPLRPLIWLGAGGRMAEGKLADLKTWRDLVLGTLPATAAVGLENTAFTDPLASKEAPTLKDYVDAVEKYTGTVEYVDPYEQNEAFIANVPEYIKPETTHVEVHPSTILSLMTSLIPFPHHNQSPRNQLSCSQSKQGISLYATNWLNRFDNTAHVLCYGEAPLTRSMYANYLGEGRMPYGQNCILAIACWSGYNQEDGIVMNADAVRRGMFRTMGYRSYEAYEEDDAVTKTKTRFGNPVNVASWKELRPGYDYSKLDDEGYVRVGEYVDENTVIVGAYMISPTGGITDASVTPQVWTRGRVEKIVVTVSNTGMRLVKVRVVQDRIPELGDKFCLTPDHEVLTEEGWKGIADVTVADKVCALNDDQTVAFVNPVGTYKFLCDNEELYNIESQQVDLRVTKNHKMYVKGRASGAKYGLVEAGEIYGKRVSYKKNGTNTQPDYQFNLPPYKDFAEVKMNMPAWLEFLGYWTSDGWVTRTERHDRGNHEYRVEICQVKKEDRERVIELIKTLGYHPILDKSGEKIFISNVQLATYLYQFSNGAAEKALPEWVWNLSSEQSRQLIKGLIQGDGTTTNTGSQALYTCSKKLADQFQRLCLQAEWSANISLRMTAGTEITIKGIPTRANYDQYRVAIVKSKNEPTMNHGHIKTQNGQREFYDTYSGGVYCIEVPSHIFYVRRNGKPVWTGNSNRHGQKGTIGALLRGHDMPRTADGLVPDMIMNPHAIPSRMTIAQNLEQLFGKAAALTGAIADGTAFMNDGSPEDQIGRLLDALGYEKYGNEILYNGATGEQIPAYIFIGPVYGMRLKHMVEDKWQARGKGRKEQKTHQPTGGRGQQGGLKIGEMDRDSLVAHSITGYLKETFMDRSDGAVVPVCVSCGLQPIYNPKMGIAVCPMCDGPVRFAGDSAANLELLPPTGRAKSRIVEVEMPYATKLLNQEVETYLNMGMRYITTSGVQRLEQLELKAVGEDAVVKELPKLIFPEIIVPERVEKEAEGKEEVTLEMLAASGQDISRLRGMAAAMEAGEELVEEGLEEGALAASLPSAAVAANEEELAESMEGADEMGVMPTAPAAIVTVPASEARNLTIMPAAAMPAAAPAAEQPSAVRNLTILQGQPAAATLAPAAPGTANVIAVDTSEEKMAEEGLGGMMGGFAPRRSFRRAPAAFGGAPAAFGGAPAAFGGAPAAFGGAPAAFGGAASPAPAMIPGRIEYDEQGAPIHLKASQAITVQKLG